MFNWRSKADFWHWAEERARTLSRRAADGWVLVSLRPSQIEALAHIPGVPTPTDEGDFPGPVQRWYGDAGGWPVILTHHESPPSGDYTDLTTDAPESDQAPWTVLKPIVAHAPELVRRVRWVHPASPEGPIAVRAVGEGAEDFDVYRTADRDDALAFVGLLCRIDGDWEYQVVDVRAT